MAYSEEFIMSHRNFSQVELDEMERKVDAFFAENKIDRSIPFDMFVLAKQLGFLVLPRPFTDKTEGMIYVDESVDTIEQFDSNKIIVYNLAFPITHVRFILAHELAHYIHEKSENQLTHVVFATRENVHQESKPIEEQRMDYMAAAILMPKKELRKDLQSYMSNTNDFVKDMSKITSDLCRKYNVGPMVAIRRIEEVLDGQ